MSSRRPRWGIRATTVPWLALAAMAAMLAPSARAAPSIAPADGLEGDVWNVARPAPAYTITGTEDGALIGWTVPGSGLQGQGASPVTVELASIPDGNWALTAGQVAPADPGRARREFIVDRTPPAIAVRRPAEGAAYDQGARVEADYECTAAVSCAGTVARGAPIDTASPGVRAFTVTARDAAGNEVAARVAYTVRARPAAAGPVPEPPASPIAVGPPPAAAPRPRVPVPVTRNASLLRPSAGARVTTSRPLLRWTARRGARLYNVQVFRVRGEAVTKAHSAFARGTAHRVPAGRLQAGERYAWRVWPFLARGGYTAVPLGVSWFDLRRPVRLTPRQLLVNQRIAQAAVRRANAIQRWLDEGLVAGDLRDGGLGRGVFAKDVTVEGEGAARPDGPSAPRPLVVAAPARAAGTAPLRATARQLLVNQRISQAAVRRANALGRRLAGGLTGGDLRAGAVTPAKLAPGLRARPGGPPAPQAPPSRTAVSAAAPGGGAVRLTDRQVLVNQRISQAAVRRANALRDLLGGGLTEAQFRPGSVGASRLG